MMLKKLFSFPNPVNEHSARMVAGGVLLLSLTYVVTGTFAILLILAYGFWARVLTGPTLSPLGQIVTRILAPLLAKKVKPQFCPGPPKRFAQSIGAFMTTSAIFAVIFADSTLIARVLVGAIVIASSLESLAGFCIGCWIFSKLMAWKIIPESVCERCVNYRGI